LVICCSSDRLVIVILAHKMANNLNLILILGMPSWLDFIIGNDVNCEAHFNVTVYITLNSGFEMHLMSKYALDDGRFCKTGKILKYWIFCRLVFFSYLLNVVMLLFMILKVIGFLSTDILTRNGRTFPLSLSIRCPMSPM